MIRIPDEVYDAANRYAGTGAGQGRRQMEALKSFVVPLLKRDEEMDSFGRDEQGLYCTVRSWDEQPGIPDKIKRKPRR